MLRIAIAQMNPTVGDLLGNTRRIIEWLGEAQNAQVDLVVFPELAIAGYLPEDLLFQRQFVSDNVRALTEIAQACHDIVAVVGYAASGAQVKPKVSDPWIAIESRQPLYNAGALIADCKMVGNFYKGYSPSNGDERRYFQPGQRASVLVINGMTIGVTIGEDLWHSEPFTRAQVAAGAEVIVNLSAAPFQTGKSCSRERCLTSWAREHGVMAVYANMVGGAG